MNRIILFTAPISREERYGKFAGIGSNLPSMALICLAAVLRKNRYEVKIVDAMAQNRTLAECMEDIIKYNPCYVGISAVTLSIIKASQFASEIKNLGKNIKIITGGPHITAEPDKTLLNFTDLDIGVIGEGEETILELLRALDEKRDLRSVAGIAFRDGEKVIHTAMREKIKDLDVLPLPAWDLLHGFPGYYRPAVFKYNKLPSTYIVSSRGCPNQCTFCDTSVFGSRLRFFSAGYVLKMIDLLVKKYGIKEVVFEDDQFVIYKERLVKICEGLIKSGHNIKWAASAKVNAVDKENLKLMKKAGCWQISYGIESCNQDILDLVKKKITLEQIKNAITLTHAAGILAKGFFIFGLPGETVQSMRNTIAVAKILKLNDISVFQLTPFPGSEIYREGAKYGSFNNDWQKMNLLNVVFVPAGLTGELLEEYQKKFIREFYLRPGIILNYIVRIIKNPGYVFSLFKAFVSFCRSTIV